MDYKEIANTLYPDLVSHILDEHKKEVKDIYKGYIDEYLNKSFGKLNDDTKQKLSKELLKHLIW